jgi:hypothetical protein
MPFQECYLSGTVTIWQYSSRQRKKGDVMANTGKSKTDNYQVGQVWTYQTRQGEESSRLIIVRTTSKPGIGKVYSIFIENIQLDVGDGEIQEQLPHAPVSKEVLDASVLEMVETRQRLPDFEWAWQEWLDAGGGVYSIPVARILNTTEQAVATANDPYPVINWEKVCVARSTPVSKQASAEQSPLASRPHKKYFFGLTPTTWILLVAMIGILALGLSLLGG